MDEPWTAVEVCSGAGGQALGLEQAGFVPLALVERDASCCATLRLNRPAWPVIEGDLRDFDGRPFRGADLFAGGLPCPPFSIAGRQLGERDERNLFPQAFRLVEEIQPRAVMIENVKGLMGPAFDGYRRSLDQEFAKLGFETFWHLLNASDFGVPQLRPRVVIVALRRDLAPVYEPPEPSMQAPPSVGETLHRLMGSSGWKGASAWRKRAAGIAPTVVGGSHKHGGPDLGPTRAKRAWAQMGVDGHGVADAPPGPDFRGDPRLTVPMVARLQGFPKEWQFAGRKTAAYRQVGNAFPPPVARAVGAQIARCLSAAAVVEQSA